MTVEDLQADVTFTGPDIPAFCDLIAATGAEQRFNLAYLRAAKRIERRASLGESEWRVVTANGSKTVIPIAGLA